MNQQLTDVQIVAHLELLVKSGKLPTLPDGTLSMTLLQRALVRRGVEVGKHRLSGLIDDLGVPRDRRNRAIDVARFTEQVNSGVLTEFMRLQNKLETEVPVLVD